MPVAEYMRLCLTHPQHGYYITHDPFGAARRFHHRARDQPDVRRADRPVDGGGLAADGRAGKRARRRARPRPRHADARRAAGGADRARISARPSSLHLVEISPALQQRSSGGWRLSACRLWHTDARRRAGRPRIIVANEFFDALPVHQAVKQADGWHERVVEIAPGRQSAFGIARDPLPHFDATLPRGIAAVARTARSTNGAPTHIALELGRRVRDRRRRADHRLRPRPVRARRHAAGRRRACLRRSAARAGRGRPDRPCRFRSAGAERRKHRRARPWAGRAARFPAPARHRKARGRAEGHARRASKAPEIEQRALAADRGRRRAAWANCSRRSPSPIRSSGRCPDSSTSR